MSLLTADNEGAYRFDVFELDPARRLLLKDGRVVQMTPKTLDTLLALIRSRGRVVEKDELMQTIWPDTIVEETNLAHNISSLRKIFGQKGGDNRFIVTSPGRGYSFVAEVRQGPRNPVATTAVEGRLDLKGAEPSAAGAGTELPPPRQITLEITADQLAAKPQPNIRRRTALILLALAALAVGAGRLWVWRPAVKSLNSLAVLPFKPIVADHRDEVLEMGVADTLITRLSTLKQIMVRPLSAVRRYTALDQDPVSAGRDLQVQAVLEGSIQKADGKIRVTTRLLNVADGKPIWTRQFDEQWTDIFAVQDAISRRVASDLMVTLSGEEQGELAKNYTTQPEAYQLYLIGRYHWNKRSGEAIQKSIESFRQAIELDRDYAMAYVGLADAYTTLGSYHLADPREVLPMARAAAGQALKIDDGLAEAHASIGKILNDYYWEESKLAESEFQKAIQLKPNYPNGHLWYSVLLANLGRFDEALRQANRALDLDYLSPVASTQVGFVYYRARRYDEGIAVLQRTLDLEPSFVFARVRLGLCYVMQAKYDLALAEFQKGREAGPDNSDFIGLLGYASGLAGRRDQARRYQEQLTALAKRSYVPPFNQAGVCAGVGDFDSAFKWLARCFDERDASVGGQMNDPLFDRVRTDPRFKQLLQRAGFTD